MNQPAVSDLTRSLIAIAWHFGFAGVDGKCCDDLTLPEFLALETAVSTGECPVQDVGRRLGFSKSGATRVVDRLERKGYVERKRSEEDGRVCCVCVTAMGRQVMVRADARYAGLFADLLTRIPHVDETSMREIVSMIGVALR